MTEQPPDARQVGETDATRTATDSSRPGATIGPYRVLQPLGHGRMSVVWVVEAAVMHVNN
jgi:hypothetical protein